MIKAIFFDIDGTLVSFKTHQIPESTIKAIHALREKGILVFIATGRHISIINNIGTLEFDGYITLNGGCCLTADKRVIYRHSIPREDISSIVHYMEQGRTFPCIFVHEDQLYMNYKNQETDKIFRLVNFPDIPIMPLQQASAGEIFQLVAFFTPEEEQQIMAHMPHCEATRWSPLFSDVIPEGSSKQVGMDKILQYFNIPLDESMAFGDGGNDIPMLKHAGISVAMGNADPVVRQAADYITSSVDEEGIFKALQHFGIL